MLYSEVKYLVCVYKWMNWLFMLKVQGDVVVWFGLLLVVFEGCKVSVLFGDKGCEINGYEQFNCIYFWKMLVVEGGKYVFYSCWIQDYIVIMGGC